jgi:hypothetical protein
VAVVEFDLVGFSSFFVDGALGEVISDECAESEHGVKDTAFEQNEMR